MADLAEKLLVDEVRIEDDRANYNVTPRTEVPIVAVSADVGRVLDRVRWGLVPSWAKDLKIGDKLINARAETIREKPAFRHAFAKKRCLIPADGFYEWKKTEGEKVKQPMFIHPGHAGDVLAFAGIYETWRDKADPDAQWIRTCAIITTSANATMAPIHNRMPVILDPAVHGEWLDPANTDLDALEQLLVPAPNDVIEAYPIRTLVNRPANNFAELLEPV